MQRVRVGLTGLGAVLLIVAVSAAIFETASQQPTNAVAAEPTQSEQTVANMIGNTVEAPSEPLAEIGVTPGAAVAPDETPPASNAAAAPNP